VPLNNEALRRSEQRLRRARCGQEPTDAIRGSRRQARESHSDSTLLLVFRYDLSRRCDDVLATRKLELQPNEASRGTRSTDGMDPHSGSADVGRPAEEWVAVEKSIHEHVDLAPTISAAIGRARLEARGT